MNKVLTTLIITLIGLSSSFANEPEKKGPLYRNYIVDHQPMPNSFFWKQELVAESTNFIPQSNPSTIKEMEHKQGILELFPVLTSNKKSSLTAPGIGIVTDNFNTINSSEISDYYSGAYISFFGVSQINKNWYGSGYITYGNYSDKKVEFNSNTDKTLLYINFGYKPESNQIYKFGLVYNSNFGDDFLLPTLGLSYSWDTIVFDALLPSYANLRFIHSQKFHTIIGTEIKYSSYYDTKKQDILEITGIDFDIRVEYKVYKMFWLHAGLVQGGEKELEWINASKKLGTIEASLKFNAGIIARF
jgi:hypothetical protein